MGRSVSYPTGAVVTFADRSDISEQYEWDDLVDDFRQRVRETYPSTRPDNRWLDREDHVVMSNLHADFGVSEYGGLVAYWVVARDSSGDSYPRSPDLAEAWVQRIAPGFIERFGELKKVGVFSNGGGIYEPINGHDPGPDQLETKPYVISGTVTDG